MKTLEIFDPAMCCSTGVCGVDVDPALVQCQADLLWLAEQGVRVDRHNLSQNPQAFTANPAVIKELEAGMECLPLTLIDGRIVARGAYLSRAELAEQLGLTATETRPNANPFRVQVSGEGCCKPGSGCC